MGLNLLQISEADTEGGAAQTAFRLHRALPELGHTTRMLVGQKLSNDPTIRLLKRGPVWRAADRAATTVLDPLGLQYVFFPSSFGLLADPWFRRADVLQLHNLHGSYFSISALPLLSRLRPTVWFLHDQWALTGHVAYSFECERWRTGCGHCPHLREYPALRRDTSALLWRWKREVYRHSRLTLVAPSRWLAAQVSDSPLLSRFPVHLVPNGVDVDRFHPQDRRAARAQLGLDPDRTTVLFAAADLNNPRKGAAVLRTALTHVVDEVQIAVAGAGTMLDLPVPTTALGELEADAMATAYAAADIFVLPTLAENLPHTLIESLACGTPVVAFDVGGVPDGVEHLETGYLAPLGDAAGLAEGINRLIADAPLRNRLGEAARRLAVERFSLRRQAESLADIFAELAE